MNHVVLVGRLTADPELRSTSGGTSYCRFTVAVDRSYVKAGEEKKVTVRVAAKAFTSVDNEGERKLFSHSFKVFAGMNQPDKRSEELTGVKCLEQDVQI